MANDLALKVTLRGDGRSLSGTLRDTTKEVKDFGTTAEREGVRADDALNRPRRGAEATGRAVHDATDEVRTFGTTTQRSGQQATSSIDRTGRSVRGVNNDLGEMRRVGDLARNSLLAIGGALSVREVISYSDAWTNAGNQLRMVTDSTAELERIQRELMAVANGSRSGFESTANLYSRLARSTTEMELSQRRLLRVTETINKSFAISGASASEADAAITQLSQGLAAGALRGDEFNSVSEQAPEIMRAIARSLNMTIGELRAFAAEGGITAEIVVNALEGASDEIDSSFGQSIASFGQKMTLARNEMLEWIGTSDEVSTAVGVAGDSIVYLAGHMDEIVTIGQVAASLYAGRLAGSLATYTAGVIAANGASLTLTRTLRALRGVMMTTFGPVGIAVAAAGVLYTFKDELFGAVPAIDANTTAVNELTAGLDDMNRATAEVTLTRLVGQLAELKAEAQEVGEAYNQIGTDEPMAGGGVLGVNVSRQVQQFREVGEASKETRQDVADVESAIAAVTDHLATLGQRGEEVKPTITEVGDSSEATASSIGRYANNLGGLLDELYPVERAQRQYHQSQLLLQTAWASGEISIERYLDALQRLEESYESTSDWADVYGMNGQAANNAIAESIDPAVVAVERGIERLDDAFVDFWKNTLSGAENTFDSFKNLAVSTLAEIIHAYTTRQITASLGLSIGGGAGGANAAGGGGFGTGGMGDLSSLGTRVYDAVSDGFSAINWMGSSPAINSGLGMQGGISSNALTGANSAIGGAGQGFLGGSFSNFGGMTGLTSLGAGWAGGTIGNQLGSELFGKQANSSYGQMAGGALGTFFGGPIGAFAGGALGGALDSLFGSGRKAKVKGWQGGLGSNGSNEYRDYHADTAFGTFTILDKVKTEPEDILNMLDAFEQIDGVLSDAMTEVQRKAVTDDFASGWKINESNVGEVFAKRYERLLRTLDGQASDGVEKALLERVPELTNDNTEKWSTALAGALQLNKLIDGLSGNVRVYASQVVDETNLSIDDALSQITAGVSAHSAVSAIADELNLTFDDMGDRAVEAALNLQQLAGGIDTLQANAQTYYQAFFTDAERQQRAIEQLSPTLYRAGLSAYSTREEFRAVVESLDLNTERGRETYNQLMSVAGAFAEISDPVESTTRSLREMATAAQEQIDSARDAVARAYETFSSQAFDQQVTLLQLAGRDQEALNLQRQQELETIDESLRPIQERIWALQDEQSALESARQASVDYRNALDQASSQLDGTLGNISAWVDQQTATGGSPTTNLQETQAQFARELVKAQNGDRDALNSITQYADRYQQAGQSYYGSGSGYQRIRDEVLDALGELPDQVSAEEYVAEEIKQALIEQTDGITTKLADVLRGDNPASISAELAGYFATLAGGIDGVLTRDQLKLVMNGHATDRQLDAMIRALDLNGDDIVSGLESVIVSGMPTDATLANVLQAQLRDNGNRALTERQVRAALSPIATDAQIRDLIRTTDANGDGLLDAQEVANARLGGLARGIAGALDSNFDKIDSSLDGLIDYGEFGRYFKGLASDSQLKQIFKQLDKDGDGQISALEAIKGSTDTVGNNTGSLEERSLEQLERLTNLTSEMARTSDQFISLNTNMVSLREAIGALGVAQSELARIEKERRKAEEAEKKKAEQERKASQLVASAETAQASIDKFQGLVDYTSQYANGNVEKYRGYDWITMDESAFADRIADWTFGSRMAAYTARRMEFRDNWQNELDDLRDDYKDLTGKSAPFALGGVFSLGRPAANSIVGQPTHFDLGLMGEAGDEAIMPLSRRADGSLGVRLDLPPMPAGGNGNQDSAEMAQLLRRLAQLTADNKALLQRLDEHGAAGNRLNQAGWQRSIDVATRGTKAQEKAASKARLEAAR